MATKVTNINMNVTEATINEEVELIPCTITPSNATEKDIVWTVVKKDGVSVDAATASILASFRTTGTTNKRYYMTPRVEGALTIRATIINGNVGT